MGADPGKSQNAASSFVNMSYMDALVQAQIEEMERDPRVILMGEDVAVYGGGKLIERFGESRVWSMPISETSFVGAAIGAAISGLRPIVDLSIASFMYLAADPIINQAAKLPYMTGGRVQVPIVFRCCMFYGSALAAQHSDRPYPVFMNIPGLKIVSPTTASDMKGLMKSAIRDDDPVLIFEDTKLWPVKDRVPVSPESLVPLGKAEVRQSGEDVTIVAIAGAMRQASEAAKELLAQGISAELIDPRTLKPLDVSTILRSIAKTHRLVVVENAHRVCGLAAEIAAIAAEAAFDHLKRPIQRVTTPDVHIPFSPALEKGLYPTKDAIVNAVKKIL